MTKFALITGSSGGIGRQTALTLAEKGWNLYLHYHSNQRAVEELLREIEKFDGEYIPVKADLSTESGPEKLLSHIFHVDALIYSSGKPLYGLFQDIPNDEMNEMWNLNVKSLMKIMQGLLPKLLQSPIGSAVVVSSIWGQTGAACEVMYSSVKGAQLAFVKSLSKELGRSSIRVNAVAPGAVKTEMMNSFTTDELSEIADEIPMGRMGEPSEVADAIEFLLSPRSSYITGQVLSVNGGWYT
ncbi:SDR family oxidoreductase [Rossellomorea vietnamensis]|uniref:SDR family oxidoreductase n=1 Tax=Rossellomorea vietnamensis TaxID=218284 RepID=A0A5D4MF49_9BACI|nr:MULTISPECIES: SDR family oxidoreductase [Bacillaceae]TYS00197.1 SDR family oxidoreductase [Rossellomorea vietnamensis]